MVESMNSTAAPQPLKPARLQVQGDCTIQRDVTPTGRALISLNHYVSGAYILIGIPLAQWKEFVRQEAEALGVFQ